MPSKLLLNGAVEIEDTVTTVILLLFFLIVEKLVLHLKKSEKSIFLKQPFGGLKNICARWAFLF